MVRPLACRCWRSFMAPMRGDVEILLERVNRARPEGDAHLTAGHAAPVAAHAEGEGAHH